MGQCINHPDRSTNLMCMKNSTFFCEECATCPSPNAHCKHRPSCIFSFMDKESKRAQKIEAA